MADYTYLTHTNISYAMDKYNKIMPGTKFKIIDSCILNIVKSFSENNAQFFMSNEELGRITLSNASTVQRSVDRLVAAGLLKKENTYAAGKPQRILVYQKSNVQKLLDLV